MHVKTCHDATSTGVHVKTCHDATSTQGGHSNYSAVHMRDRRNAKKGCFFEARIPFRGQNVPIFEKKGPFRFYYGAFRVIFQTPTKMSLQKACLAVNLRTKSRDFFFLL